MEKNQHLEQLYRLSVAIGTTLDLTHETVAFMEWLTQTVEPTLAALFITDEAKQELRLVGADGFDPPADPRLPMGLDVWHWLAEQGASLPGDAPRHYAVPVSIEKQLLGTLCLVSKHPPEQLADEQRLVSTAAGYLAPVLRNIWRFQTLERRVAERTAALEREIAERVRAEEALKEYSERLEEMVDERTQELREAQAELVRKERLTVLGQLAGGVAHELRNPLAVISNAVYYLKMVISDADETVTEYLEMVSSEVNNAAKIVSDLLDFARTRPPERGEVAVSGLVAEVLRKQPPPEGVQVSTEIAPDLPTVFVDPQQIELVLVNLVTNAYQAMPEGGVLTISARAAKSPYSGEKDQVALSVTDTGVGIPEENLEKLFEPLFTTKARGIGLGLATCKNLVEANGGSFSVQSEVGEGSTFTVRLPVQEVEA